MDIKSIIAELGVRVDLIVILLILMVLDILVGIIRAFYQGTFKSKILREGLIKKLFEVIIILIGYVLDYVLGLKNIGVAVTYLLIGAEAYSIVVENISEFIPIPQILKDAIDSLRGEKKEDIDNGERF